MRRAFAGAWKFHARSGISTARPHYGISTFFVEFPRPVRWKLSGIWQAGQDL